MGEVVVKVAQPGPEPEPESELGPAISAPPVSPRDAADSESLRALTRQLSRTLSVTGEEEVSTRTSWKKAVLLLAVIATGVVCLVYLPVKEWLAAVFGYVQEQGTMGAVLVVALYIPTALLNLPSPLMALGCGCVYGLWAGTALALLGYHVGSLAGLFAGRYAVRCCVEAYIHKNAKLRRTLKLIQAQPLKFVAICRVSPFLPYCPTNYVFGFGTDIAAIKFVLASIPFALPGVFLQANTGSALSSVTVRPITPSRCCQVFVVSPPAAFKLAPWSAHMVQDIAGDIELGLWDFWVPTIIGLSATVGLSAYSMRVYQDLVVEEEEAELAVIKEKERLGVLLTRWESRKLRQAEQQQADLTAIIVRKQQGAKLTKAERRALQREERKEERKRRKCSEDNEEQHGMIAENRTTPPNKDRD